MRTGAAHRALALLHLHHALLHGGREFLSRLTHIHLRRRHLLDDAFGKRVLVASLPLRVELLIVEQN